MRINEGITAASEFVKSKVGGGRSDQDQTEHQHHRGGAQQEGGGGRLGQVQHRAWNDANGGIMLPLFLSLSPASLGRLSVGRLTRSLADLENPTLL